jgi:hypothetical protein
MKNKDNTMPAEKFNPPTQHECFMDGKPAGVCHVYDASSWRNRNKRSAVPNEEE